MSQYLSEQQRLSSVAGPTTTMSLLPELDVSAKTEAQTFGIASDRQPLDLFPQHAGLGTAAVPEEKKSQLTIFYGGKMLVFQDFPADKANDLMLMAGKGSSVNTPSAIRGTTCMPLKKRASLHRFMEKRRERIHSSKKLYQIDESRTNSSTQKPVTSLPWFLHSSQPESSPESRK